jgi:NosR/NirI family nitrous oxide reductase transcriptional regulator
VISAAYASRDKLVRRSDRQNKWPVNAFKYTGWVVSIGFVGFYAMAQPSITQVLTWFHSLLFQWKWELFLSDPLIFIFWIFIIITVFVWGRGLFCGWLCPFGSLSELLYKVGSAVGLKRFQFHLPQALHDKLKWLKYAIFFGLLAVSFFSMGLAEQARRGRTLQDHLPGRHPQPQLALQPVRGVACWACRSSWSGPSANTCAPSAPRWPCPPPSAGSASGGRTNAPAARPAPRAAARWPSTPRATSTSANACCASTAWCSTTTTTPARPWPRNASAATKAGQPLTPIDGKGYFIPIKPVPDGQEQQGAEA